MPLLIAPEDPRSPDVVSLLRRHLDFADLHSPPEHVHALDVDGLAGPDVAFFGARDDGALLGVGALKRIDTRHAEVKSMHTAEAARGRGIGRAVLRHLLDHAARQGFDRVSLETGSMAAFAPARALYAAAGFAECEPFAGYSPGDYSAFMTLELATPRLPA